MADPGEAGRPVPVDSAEAVRRMLEAGRVALVGASPRADSFGLRMAMEVGRSPAKPELLLVNPHYEEVLGHRCLPSLEAVDGPVDLVVLGVGDTRVEDQLRLAAKRGDRSAVVFSNLYEAPGVTAQRGGVPLRQRLTDVATESGMALCGGGCMGFVNLVRGLYAIGYQEPDPLPEGPVALLTHSGSAFSALLRTRHRIGYTLAVSSGQELVTTTAEYLHYALSLERTRVVALLLETLRRPAELRAGLLEAAERDVAVVALTVGGSPTGRRMVSAHSGALAGDDAAWEALFDAYGVLRVGDLSEMADTLELLCAGRPAKLPVQQGGGTADGRRTGIATVHDSGAERALVADLAHELGVPFAEISPATAAQLADLLDPGLEPQNPLDVWGRGADTRALFSSVLSVLAEDDAVAALALCVDLVHEHDGDIAYRLAALDAAATTAKPLAVLSNAPGSLDLDEAALLRQADVPVLEGSRPGLRALGHLVALAERRQHHRWPGILDARRGPSDPSRAAAWSRRLAQGALGATGCLQLLGEYGVPVPPTRTADDLDGVLRAAGEIGYPVVLKTDQPGLSHKSDVGGVRLDLGDAAQLTEAYRELATRLGPAVVVAAQAPPGVELSLGLVRDPVLGPLVVLGAGGVLVELLGDRVVGLPPLDRSRARAMVDRLALRPLLDGYRGSPPVDLEALIDAVLALSEMAVELGPQLAALEVNPLRAHPEGVVALDVLVELGTAEGATALH